MRRLAAAFALAGALALATPMEPAIAADTWDGYSATVVAQAGVRALKAGHKVEVQSAPRPALYARGDVQ